MVELQVCLCDIFQSSVFPIELINICFSAVTVLKGYAFIQYAKEDEARAAVAGENGNWIKGQKIGMLSCLLFVESFLFA